MMVACSCNSAIQEWNIISHHSSPHHLRLRLKFCVMHESMRHARWLVQYRRNDANEVWHLLQMRLQNSQAIKCGAQRQMKVIIVHRAHYSSFVLPEPALLNSTKRTKDFWRGTSASHHTSCRIELCQAAVPMAVKQGSTPLWVAT